MSDKPFSPKMPEFEYPDAAGYPDGAGTLQEGTAESEQADDDDIVDELGAFLSE